MDDVAAAVSTLGDAAAPACVRTFGTSAAAQLVATPADPDGNALGLQQTLMKQH